MDGSWTPLAVLDAYTKALSEVTVAVMFLLVSREMWGQRRKGAASQEACVCAGNVLQCV